MMNTALARVEDGIVRCEKLKEQFPELPVLGSIANQLLYLKSILVDCEADRSRLNEIIIGVQTAREIEALDMETAEVFYEISELARGLGR